MRPRALQWYAAVLPLLLSVAHVHADEPEATEQPEPANDEVSVSTETTTELLEAARAYDELIRELEVRGGPFDPGIAEALVSQGRALIESGDYAGAVAALERGLHVARVNEGLHDMRHAPIVELIIESNLALRNWDALDRNYEFLYWLYRRNYGTEGPRVVPFMEQFADRRLNAGLSDAGEGALNHFIKADDLYDAGIRAAQTGDAAEEERLKRLLAHSAVANFYISDLVLDTQLPLLDLREAMLENGRAVTETNPQVTRDRVSLDAFFKGDRAIVRMAGMTGARVAEDPLAHAETLVFHGDYLLGSRRKWDAMRRYEAAWAVLKEYSVRDADIARLFGEPRQLANLTTPYDDVPPSPQRGESGAIPPSPLEGEGSGEKRDSDPRTWVEAQFDVPASGWPANVRIVHARPEDDADLIRRGELAVLGVRYRPRFENGKPVDTRNVTLQYMFRQ